MSYSIDERLIEAQFWQSMRQAGIKPRYEFSPIMDGKLHRFSVESDKHGETSGAYIVHADEWPNWHVQDFHIQDSMLHFSFDKDALSSDERQAIYQELNNPEYQAAVKAKREQEQLLQKEKEAKALANAIHEYECADFAGVSLHPYIYQRFISKNFFIPSTFQAWDFEYALDVKPPSNALKLTNQGDLLIPITNILTSKIQDFQIISSTPDQRGKFQKRFYTGLSPKNGCVEILPLNSLQQNIVYLCEGYCTALAVLILTRGNFPVFAALSASNLINVAEGLRKRYSGKKIFVMADNDRTTELKTGNNTGIVKANQVLREGLCDKVIPAEIEDVHENIDWYDILKSKGAI